MGCAGCPLVMTIIHYIVSIRFNSFLCLPCVPDSSYLAATSRYMSHMTSKSILATARSVISAALTILATICLQPRFRLLSVSQKSRKAVSAQSNGKERQDWWLLKHDIQMKSIDIWAKGTWNLGSVKWQQVGQRIELDCELRIDKKTCFKKSQRI